MSHTLKLFLDNMRRNKPANLITNEGGVADIYVYDVISSYWGVTALDVIAAIAAVKDASVLNVHINSPGGDVFEGRAIMAALKTFKGKTVAVIDSLCASAATSVALACNEVQMHDGAFFMIHNAQGMAYGDKQEMRDYADLLQKIEGAIVDDYIAKTGKTSDEIAALMDAETWFSAQEALDAGFIDVVCPRPEKTTGNTWNLAAFKNTPKALTDFVGILPAPAQVPVISNEYREHQKRQVRLRNVATHH